MEISSIPLTFILGFYVNMIVTRWWQQYILLPWPDSIAIFLVGLMKGLLIYFIFIFMEPYQGYSFNWNIIEIVLMDCQLCVRS